jgi:hypothetical protein
MIDFEMVNRGQILKTKEIDIAIALAELVGVS